MLMVRCVCVYAHKHTLRIFIFKNPPVCSQLYTTRFSNPRSGSPNFQTLAPERFSLSRGDGDYVVRVNASASGPEGGHGALKQLREELQALVRAKREFQVSGSSGGCMSFRV